MASLKTRLERLEAALYEHEQPLFDYCIDWEKYPESRPEIAAAMHMSIAAAEYVCTVGLKHGRPKDASCPFEAWTTAELRKAIELIDK